VSPRHLTAAVAVAVSLTPLASIGAQVVTVTTPVGVYTEPGPVNTGDPFALDTWLRTNVRNNGSVGITNTYARSGNGSAYFNGAQGPSGASSKADFEYFFGGQYVSPFALGTLTGLSYDYYRDASSTNSAIQVPSLRMYLDFDGNAATADYGYMIYEPYYTQGAAGVVTGAWQSETIGSSSIFWVSQFGHGNENVYRPLSDYTTNGYTPNAGFTQITRSSIVLGLSSGIGSGWGPFTGAVDNIRVQYGSGASAKDVTFNFETASTTTPEPATTALTATGLLALVGIARRRKA
jgi:hypothetical protein